jgi:acyl carrier protein
MSRLADNDDFSKNLSFFWDFDSMADVEIVCALEEKFGIKISDEEAEKAHTISEIVNLVYSKIGA